MALLDLAEEALRDIPLEPLLGETANLPKGL
jgi:hypothetical protein